MRGCRSGHPSPRRSRQASPRRRWRIGRRCFLFPPFTRYRRQAAGTQLGAPGLGRPFPSCSPLSDPVPRLLRPEPATSPLSPTGYPSPRPHSSPDSCSPSPTPGILSSPFLSSFCAPSSSPNDPPPPIPAETQCRTQPGQPTLQGWRLWTEHLRGSLPGQDAEHTLCAWQCPFGLVGFLWWRPGLACRAQGGRELKSSLEPVGRD